MEVLKAMTAREVLNLIEWLNQKISQAMILLTVSNQLKVKRRPRGSRMRAELATALFFWESLATGGGSDTIILRLYDKIHDRK